MTENAVPADVVIGLRLVKSWNRFCSLY